jgi:stringent starvation protein B
MSQAMTSNRPYLIRAIYDWVLDNQLTPYLLADAEHPAIQVPPGSEQDGKVVLNLSPTAIRDLNLGNEFVMFNARFGGVAQEVAVPVPAILAVYAQENGQGMLFPQEEANDQATPTEDSEEADNNSEEPTPPDNEPSPPAGGGGRGHLKVVK